MFAVARAFGVTPDRLLNEVSGTTLDGMSRWLADDYNRQTPERRLLARVAFEVYRLPWRVPFGLSGTPSLTLEDFLDEWVVTPDPGSAGGPGTGGTDDPRSGGPADPRSGGPPAANGKRGRRKAAPADAPAEHQPDRPDTPEEEAAKSRRAARRLALGIRLGPPAPAAKPPAEADPVAGPQPVRPPTTRPLQPAEAVGAVPGRPGQPSVGSVTAPAPAADNDTGVPAPRQG